MNSRGVGAGRCERGSEPFVGGGGTVGLGGREGGCN